MSLALSIVLAKIQNVPTLFTKTLLSSSGLASPEPPLLQIPGEAFLYNASNDLELVVVWSQFISTFLNSEKPRDTSAGTKVPRSF